MHALNRASAATLAIAAAIAILPTGPSAASVLISGSGVFDVTAPTTAISAPGETFSFSFELPNPISANPTTEGTDFSYDLGGSPVADGLAEVEFFTTASSGLFDIDFVSGDLLSIYGADVGSSLTISTGVFPATVGVSDGPAVGAGTVTISSVPEPAAWALMLIGVGGLGSSLRARRGLGLVRSV